VSDHSRQIARGLAADGDEVHVFTPPAPGANPQDAGVLVHTLRGRYTLRAIAQLDAAFGRLPRPYRVLVAYVPQSFGWRGMNLPVCLWLRFRSRGERWVIFHEVAFPMRWNQRIRRNFLGLVHRVMVRLVVGGAARIFIASPHWEALLRKTARIDCEITVLPVPTNIPAQASPNRAAAIRSSLLTSPGGAIIGHFGTYGPRLRSLVAKAIVPLVAASPDRLGLLLGRGADEFRARLVGKHPEIASRVHAAAELPGEEVAAHLAACDLLVQPYEDGVGSRRSSLMAGLALGLPIVTNEGVATEAFWRESGAIAIAHGRWPEEVQHLVEALLSDGAWRRELGERARSFYQERFSVEHTLRALRLAARG